MLSSCFGTHSYLAEAVTPWTIEGNLALDFPLSLKSLDSSIASKKVSPVRFRLKGRSAESCEMFVRQMSKDFFIIENKTSKYVIELVPYF